MEFAGDAGEVKPCLARPVKNAAEVQDHALPCGGSGVFHEIFWSGFPPIKKPRARNGSERGAGGLFGVAERSSGHVDHLQRLALFVGGLFRWLGELRDKRGNHFQWIDTRKLAGAEICLA
jgi:hypothetical protein